MMRIFLAAALATVSLVGVTAHEFTAGEIEILHPYVKATPPGAKTAAGYITFEVGAEADRLVGIETLQAEQVDLHRNEITDGIARMRPMPQGLALPANTTTVLGDHGTHAMFVEIAGPFTEGQMIEATLVFEKAGTVPVTLKVEPLAGPAEEHAHGL